MQLDILWEQVSNALYQFWVWLRYEYGLHPFMALGLVLIIILAWMLYKGQSIHK
ncbi:MAG: hypothetical protein M0P73_09900 [Syntrophobacterales bacterium]|jgi:hypothetical protein|nr:hypothetical protein [Syntrophobacterales bacterium]